MQQVSMELREFGGKSWVIYTAAAYRTPTDERPGIGTAWKLRMAALAVVAFAAMFATRRGPWLAVVSLASGAALATLAGLAALALIPVAWRLWWQRRHG